MNIDPSGTSTASVTKPATGAPRSLQFFVIGLFFVFGGLTSLNDVLIPKLKDLFTLGYAQAMLVQFAFFAAYFTISIPAALLVRRFGYMRTAAIGLMVMTTGCLLFIPASQSGIFSMFLFALFVLASGVTTVQVVANPLISILGPASTAHSRLTFAQAFNSLGTTVFPYVGSILILGSLTTINARDLAGAALESYRSVESMVIVHTYVGLAAALTLVAVAVWSMRSKLQEKPEVALGLLKSFDLLLRPRFAFGALCIFLYVGAEVTVGSFIVSYLMQADGMGLAERDAGMHVPLYWGGAMLGRFIGTWALRVYSPGKVLATAAFTAALLLLASSITAGSISGWTLLAVGLCNSIMFPTIFSLGCENLGSRMSEGSGIFCMAIVGGAIVPLIAGYTADHSSLKIALFIPLLCYVTIMGYGWYACESRTG
ncbi:sugar MFS transporter [Hydrocarboniphaga sp.]|uniref:sugar MFS transporter n=1 Tax=Hydrocarboniphaga sp. TaxID=2033016 RepID=UPI003453C142